MGLILLPRQGGWCHLRCCWAAVLAFSCHCRRAQVSHRSCVTPARLNRPFKWPRTSPVEQYNHVWTDFHPTHLHIHLTQLYPRRYQVPQSLESSLLLTPTKKWVLLSEEKNSSEVQMDSLHSFLGPQPYPFLLSHFLTSLAWPFQIHLDPDCQTEINKELFPFSFILPSISSLDFPLLCHISGLWPYSSRISEPRL